MDEDWNSGKYFHSGIDTASAISELVGPIKGVIQMPVTTPFLFGAGLIYGFTSINHLTEMATCYNDDVESLKLVKLALREFQSGDKAKALAYLGSFVKSLNKDK